MLLTLLIFSSSIFGCIYLAKKIPRSTGQIIDIVHSNVPVVNLSYSSDILTALQIAYTATKLTWGGVETFLSVMVYAQLGRMMTITTTILPPLKRYEDKYRFGGINGVGSEYIYSGHSCYASICYIMLWNCGVNPFLLTLYNLFSQGLIIATRNHYTVDVVLSWLIVPLIYGNVKAGYLPTF